MLLISGIIFPEIKTYQLLNRSTLFTAFILEFFINRYINFFEHPTPVFPGEDAREDFEIG